MICYTFRKSPSLWNINLANKLHCLLLVLQETLKTLLQNVRNCLSLAGKIKNSTVTWCQKQQIIPGKVRILSSGRSRCAKSVKNQEKTQEKIQKKNVPQQQQQQQKQQHFLREHNTDKVQSQFVHEIFQSNVRPQKAVNLISRKN